MVTREHLSPVGLFSTLDTQGLGARLAVKHLNMALWGKMVQFYHC